MSANYKSVWGWLCWKWEKPGFRILIAVAAAVALLSALLFALVRFGTPTLSESLVITVLGVAFVILLGFFIHLFTTSLPDSDDEQAVNNLQRKWMFLAYTFMILALFGAVYPFTVDLTPDQKDLEYVKHVNETLDSPMAVFRGCVDSSEASAKALHCYPEGDKLQPPRLSWVLQVGGYVSPFQMVMPQDERPEDVEKSLKEAQIAYRKASNELTHLEQILGEKDTPRTEPLTDTNQETIAAARKKKQTARDLVNIYLHWQRYDQGNYGYFVTGGLVIPFYLVMLSLIGGAISLTRRIPEYQKQAAPGYMGTPDAPYLTPPMLREYLVFQIVQFISAPFIAAVAYYVLEPTTTSATVGLAFAAGFASETVLLWVRAMVDKIKPDAHVEQETGSLVGSLTGQPGASAVEIEKAYTISIVGLPALPPVFFDGGQFVINGVPKGACALEVIRLESSGDEPRTICQRVIIDAGKPTPVIIDLV